MAQVETAHVNGHINGHADGNDVEAAALEPVSKYASNGIILPPPEIKSVIDRSALAIARSANPPQFEEKLRENQRNDPKFSFLNPADPYHNYYRDRMDRIEAGEVDNDGTGAATSEAGQPSGEGMEVDLKVDEVMEPPPPEFILDLPNISPLDLDILKLTALFTARRGRAFLGALSVREGRNFQFEFLRPSHSLFPYFNRLVEQYTKIMSPSAEAILAVSEHATPRGKWELLASTQKYAIWERTKRGREKKRSDDKELERLAHAEIDWHDYAIVQTIEFTMADANADLPAPMSRTEVENMTLAQKRMAAMIMEDAGEEIAAHQARQAAADAEANNAASALNANGITTDEDEDYRAMLLKEEEDRNKEQARARAIQASNLDAGGPMKIRTDYVPKLGQKGNKNLTTCTVCGQQIPIDEIDEHMRIELLDPKWKSQRDAIEARRAQASELQRGANVVSSISEFAKARVDIFGDEEAEAKRKRAEEDDRQKRKEKEKGVWDGHTASKAGITDKYSTNANFEEQIAAIHKAKGWGRTVDENAVGPGIGPSIIPPPLASLPAHPGPMPNQAMGPGIISSAPQPASQGSQMTQMGPPIQMGMGMPPALGGSTPVSLPTLHYQGMNAPQPFGYQPPPPGMTMGMMHPSRMAAMAGGPGSPAAPGQPGQLAGTVRSADEMTGGEDAEEENREALAKRQRVAKLPGGHMYPEQNWIDMHPHPITLKVQLPTDTSKAEWKLDGSLIDVPDLHVTTLVSTLRERITKPRESSVPQSRIRLFYDGKEMRNANTIASYNLEDGDVITFAVRDAKKK